MATGKNPFEHSFRGSAEKSKPEPKPDVTTSSGKRALQKQPDATMAPPKKASSPSSSVMTNRMSSDKGDEAVTGRSASGFQAVNPFNRQKYDQVKHPQYSPGDPAWDTKKVSAAPAGTEASAAMVASSAAATAPGTTAVASKPMESVDEPSTPPVVVGGAVVSYSSNAVTGVTETAKGFEVMQTGSSNHKYSEQYVQRVDAAQASVAEKASQQVTSDNYQDVYQAQQQVEAEQKIAEQNQQMGEFIKDRQKHLDEASMNAHRARSLLAEMGQLQIQLVPNMEPYERHQIYAKLEELRIALAQIPFYG